MSRRRRYDAAFRSLAEDQHPAPVPEAIWRRIDEDQRTHLFRLHLQEAHWWCSACLDHKVRSS